MVRLIMSGSGEGKTKQLLELMNSSAETEAGCMVCIEPTRNMSYNLRHQTRLVDASEYDLGSFASLRGFICGLYAGNYDISHIFIDNLCKVVGSSDDHQVDEFLTWAFVASVRCDAGRLSAPDPTGARRCPSESLFPPVLPVAPPCTGAGAERLSDEFFAPPLEICLFGKALEQRKYKRAVRNLSDSLFRIVFHC